VRPRKCSRWLLVALLAAACAIAQSAPAAGDDSFIKGKGKEKKGASEPDDGLKPFDEIVAGCERVEGLFPVYRNRDLGKLWIELAPDRLDRPYIWALTREAAEGIFFDNSALMGESILTFHREGKKIHWILPNMSFFSTGDSAFARAVERGVSRSLLGVTEIASKPHPERKSILIDPSSILLQDHGWVGYVMREAQAGYSLDRDGSYVDVIKNFPLNTEIQVVLTFRTDNPKVAVPILPDARSFQHRYHWSLVDRPSNGYRPRLADDRVGHFLTMHQDYSNPRSESPYVRYVNRWRLEKQDPTAPISPPKEPIVYWIENTVPVEYRDEVERGVLAWNKAFETAGFRDAIVVKQMPDTATWDPADVRYSVIRWMLQPGADYAVGPSRSDPVTGEIFDADIRIAADLVRTVYREWTDQISPLTRPGRASSDDGAEGDWLDPGASRGGVPGYGPHDRCDPEFAEGMARQAAFGMGIAAVRGLFDPESPEGKKYVDDYMAGLVCHEVGHTLGLRHNFRSSVINTLDQLQDVARTKAVGITGSIMDYTPVNLARIGETQGEYWQLEPGVYDHWAIEYAYKPIDAQSPEDEVPELERIASRAADPLLTYGTDEDARGLGPTGIDPASSMWDLGDDPLAWSASRMDLADELWSRMDEYLSKPGQEYRRYRTVFSQGIAEYWYAANIIPKHIGGIHHYRDHVGDPGGRLPFEPVPAAKQRHALKLLTERVLSEKAFKVAPELLNKIAPDRMPTFGGNLYSSQRIDPPFYGRILGVQTRALDRLYHPITLSRLQDLEARYAADEEKFRMIEMFETLRGAIWSEVAGGRPVGTIRRNLQRAHLNRLIEIAVDPEEGTPEDATTLARADLKAIMSRCATALGRADLDPMTRAHLDETRDRAKAALDAPVSRSIPDPAAGPRM